METRANYALIGAFTIAVILAGFGYRAVALRAVLAARSARPSASSSPARSAASPAARA